MPSLKPPTYADRKAKGDIAMMLWFPKKTAVELLELRQLLGLSKTAAIGAAVHALLVRVKNEGAAKKADAAPEPTQGAPRRVKTDDEPDAELDRQAGYTRRSARPIGKLSADTPQTLADRIRERGSSRAARVVRTGEEVSRKQKAWKPKFVTKTPRDDT